MRPAPRVTAWIAATLLSPALAHAEGAKDPKTERTFKAKCASCHGADGKGETEQAKKMGGIGDMTSAAWQKKWSDEQIKSAIENGVHETRDGNKKEMDAYKSKLPAPQIDALVVYIRGLGK